MEEKWEKGIRTLYPEEIECRIGLIREKGLTLLLYKDARVDQKILDETFGTLGWKRQHEMIGGSLYCTVSVRDKKTGEWISKQDVGSASGNTETEKSLASDSFKRACVNWGIGRELYSAPFVWIPKDRAAIRKDGNRFSCSDRFYVTGISYDSRNEITSLVVENQDGKRVFAWQRKQAFEENANAKAQEKAEERQKITQSERKRLDSELERTGVTMDRVNERFHVKDPEEMSPEVYRKLMKALAATQSKQAA